MSERRTVIVTCPDGRTDHVEIKADECVFHFGDYYTIVCATHDCDPSDCADRWRAKVEKIRELLETEESDQALMQIASVVKVEPDAGKNWQERTEKQKR